MTRTAVAIARSSLLVLAGVLALAVATAVFLAYTRSGAELLLDAAKSRVALQHSNLEGSLAKGLRVSSLEYSNESLVLEIRDGFAQLDWSCLLQRRICLETLEVRELVVKTTRHETAKDSTPFAFEALPWPPRGRVKSLSIARLKLTLAGRPVEEFERLELGLLARRGEIAIERLSGRHALLAWSAQGVLTRSGTWELGAQFSLDETAAPATPAVQLPRQIALRADGDLGGLQGRLVAGERGAAERVVGGTGVALDFDADFPVGEQTLALRGSLDGIDELLPQLANNPWTQLSGPLRFEIDTDATNTTAGGGKQGRGSMRVQIQQLLRGYDSEELLLFIALREKGAAWMLETAQLGRQAVGSASDGPAHESFVAVEGSLGSLSMLKPELVVRFNEFTPPPATQSPVGKLNGDIRVKLTAESPGDSWSLQTSLLRLEERKNSGSESAGEPRNWEFAADLQASEPRFLPTGEATARLQAPQPGSGAALPEGLAVSYQRDPERGAVARLQLPQGLQTEALEMSSLSVSAIPAPSHAPGSGTIDAAFSGDLEGDLRLSLASSPDAIDVRIEPLDLLIKGQPVRSDIAIDGRWAAGSKAVTLEPFCLLWRSNRGCLGQTVLGRDGELSLNLSVDEDYRGQAVQQRYALRARGDGQLLLRWEDAAFVAATADLEFPQLEIDPVVKDATSSPVRWDRAQLSARLTPSIRRLELALESAELGGVDLSIAERDGGISGSVTTDTLQLRILGDLLPQWALSKGTLNTELKISGRRSAPLAHGHIELSDAQMELPAIGSELEAVNLRIEALGDHLEVDGRASLGQGSLRLTGVCCDDGEFRANLDGKQNRLSLPVGVNASVSPELKLRLNTEQIIVTGTLRVHEGVLEHSGPRDGGVAISDDVLRLDTPTVAPRRFDLLADLRTIIEPGFIVRSQELQATAAGDLRLSLRPDSPAELYGNLEVLGGDLRAYGQSLRLTQGAVGFLGDPLNPDLNLSAEREIRAEQLRVGFRVRGRLEAPSFELFSDPVRPERETLSYLLRGRGPDAGASLDGTAMALSLGASAINQSGVLQSLNTIPGLSGVSLGAEGSEEDMAATISAYVGQRLYLSYGVGIYEPVNALTARLYLRSRLWLEVVSRLESSFDLYYRFDLD